MICEDRDQAVLVVPGYLTVGMGVSLHFCACGLGLPPGVRVFRQVLRIETVDQRTGRVLASSGPLFPWQSNTNVQFSHLDPRLRWAGYLARVNQAVPSNCLVALRITFQYDSKQPRWQSQLLQELRAGAVATDEWDVPANRPKRGIHESLSQLQPLDWGDCCLYYKFDDLRGPTVINYGAEGCAPALGQMFDNPVNRTRTSGRFGRALRGAPTVGGESSYTDSGWFPDLECDFTVGFFLRGDGAVVRTPDSYVFGLPPAVTTQDFWCRITHQSPTTIRLTCRVPRYDQGTNTWSIQDLVTTLPLPHAQWRHIGLVVDGTTKTATWYLDGAQWGAAIPMSVPVKVVDLGRTFLVGAHHPAGRRVAFDLDEFKFCRRAATAAEIATWSRDTWAAARSYDKGCGGALQSTAPVLGRDVEFTLQGTQPGQLYALAIGDTRNRTALPGLACPLSITPLAGFLFLGRTSPGGDATLKLPVPNFPSMIGGAAFVQSAFHLPSALLPVSNAVALSFGR